ncbi:MAG: hypothetical protein KIT56_02325 [Gammaproteobacteria bacterium]|nr:hypothetical protein [Gammaproteobacteria bacterium]
MKNALICEQHNENSFIHFEPSISFGYRFSSPTSLAHYDAVLKMDGLISEVFLYIEISSPLFEHQKLVLRCQQQHLLVEVNNTH